MKKNEFNIVDFIKIYSEDKLALFFLINLIFILILVIFGPLFTLQNPYDLSQLNITYHYFHTSYTQSLLLHSNLDL